MKFQKFINNQAEALKNDKEFLQVVKEISSKYKGKDPVFIGMVDNGKYGRHYSFLIDGNTRTIIKK